MKQMVCGRVPQATLGVCSFGTSGEGARATDLMTCSDRAIFGGRLAAIVWPALLGVTLYLVTLWGGYVYDDQFIARDDPRVWEAGRWTGYLREPYFGPVASDAPLWRPAASLTYALQYRLFGTCAWPAHLINVLLHGVVSGLVGALGMRLTRSVRVGLVAGLLFAAHPVHVEAVANIVGRAELLCAMAVLCGLLLFLRNPLTMGRALLIVACFIFAIASKEHGLLLLPMLIAAAPLRRAPVDAPAGRGERNRLGLLFFFLCLCTLAYTSYRERFAPFEWEKFFFQWDVNPLFRARGLDRALLPFTILGRYAYLLFTPISLSPDYGANVTLYRLCWNDPWFYAGCAALLVYTVTLVFCIRRRKWSAGFCLISIGVAYALIGNAFFLIGTAVGERLLYLASAFFVILVAMLLSRLRPRVLAGALTLILALAAVRTTTYAWEWNNALRLFHRARLRHPESVKLYLMEARTLESEGRAEEADQLLAQARALVPECAEAWQLSARLACAAGHDEQALQYERRALELELNPPHMR